MTTVEFIAALKEFCLENGFEIAGTCETEGIYGEITVTKVGHTPKDWDEWSKNIFNFEEA
jgi:hypothetical protein